MPRHSILVATENKRAVEYITTYFQDTESIPTIIRSKRDLSAMTSCKPDILFFETDWAGKRAASWLNELKEARERFRCIGLGRKGQHKFRWDGLVDFPLDDRAFRKVVFSAVAFPNPV